MPNEIITAESVITLSKNTLIRFEHNFNEGTLILINTKNDSLWFGNKETLPLVNLFRNNIKPLKIIIAELLTEYKESEIEEAFSAINSTIENLYSKGFLELLPQ